MKTDYQIFISFKNSDDETEEDTLDKEIAYKIYKYLTDRRLNVFFSPVTLKALGRDSWSEEIDSALKQSKVFIAVGTQKEYMNAKWVKEERTKFFGLKLNDESRAIYGYIASSMTLKDLPEDMGKLEVFQDKRPKELVRLYTYIRNHLAHNKNIVLKEEIGFNKNYLLIGVLILVGVFFFNSNDNGDLVEIIKEERLEDKKIIEEQKKENKKDKELIAFLLTKLKDHPNYDEILKQSEKIEKSEGKKAVINYLRSIDLDYYQNKDSVEIVDNTVKSIEMKDNVTDIDTEEVVISNELDKNDSIFKSIALPSISSVFSSIALEVTSFQLDNNDSLLSEELLSGTIGITNWSYYKSIHPKICMYLLTEKDIQSDKTCGDYHIPPHTKQTYKFQNVASIKVDKKTVVLFIIEDEHGKKLRVEKIVIYPYKDKYPIQAEKIQEREDYEKAVSFYPNIKIDKIKKESSLIEITDSMLPIDQIIALDDTLIQEKTTEILNERITTQNDPNIINMTDTDGKSYSIKVLGNDIKIEGMEGKVVFLEFFGLNCPACKDLIHNLISLKEKHKEKFQVMAIEVQKHDVDPINAYKKAHNINFITLSNYDAGSMVSYVADKSEWSGVIPFTIIINPKGEVQFTQEGVMSEEQMEKYIETYSK